MNEVVYSIPYNTTAIQKKNRLEGEGYLNALSTILIGLGIWLVIDGALSIVKYPKQSYPEHLIRVVRAMTGAIIIIIGIVQN
jgi:hypothetical protein